MAEEKQGVQNMGLLLIAIALGVVVVIVYNVQIHRIREGMRGTTMRLLKFRRDMRIGDDIKRTDVEVHEIEAQRPGEFGNVMPSKELEYLITQSLRKSARKGEFVMWGHVLASGGEKASGDIKRGMIAKTVPIDSATSPGTILSVGDRINLIGIFRVNKGKPKAYRILTDVRVHRIGGMGPAKDSTSAKPSRASKGMRSFKSVTLELTPAVSLQIENLQTHVLGEFTLEVRNLEDRSPPGAGQVHPELETLASEAKPPRESGRGGFSTR